MIDFIASISVFGWLLIGVCLLGLVFLPRLLRGEGRSNVPDQTKVGQPPDYRGPPG